MSLKLSAKAKFWNEENIVIWIRGTSVRETSITQLALGNQFWADLRYWIGGEGFRDFKVAVEFPPDC